MATTTTTMNAVLATLGSYLQEFIALIVAYFRDLRLLETANGWSQCEEMRSHGGWTGCVGGTCQPRRIKTALAVTYK